MWTKTTACMSPRIKQCIYVRQWKQTKCLASTVHMYTLVPQFLGFTGAQTAVIFIDFMSNLQLVKNPVLPPQNDYCAIIIVPRRQTETNLNQVTALTIEFFIPRLLVHNLWRLHSLSLGPSSCLWSFLLATLKAAAASYVCHKSAIEEKF